MYPDAQTNLLDAYGLQSIADSVARQDKQGNKINKLRKSYKRYIQDLPGKEDYPPKEPTGKPDFDKTLPKPGMDLMEMLILPEEEWQNRYVHGKDITRGLELGALRRACQLGSTPIPNFDASVLGIDESEAAAAVLGQPPARNPKQKPAFAASAMGYNNSHHHPNSGRGTPNYHSTSSYNGTPGAAPYSTHSPLPSKNAELKRPSRKKRRRYDDQSFEGYEGFDTDDDVKGGSKRKKDYDLGNNHPTSIPGRITIGGGGGDAYGR
ncbi:mediator complex, subunit MED19 [Ascobolus immersus RN42]|uniref:Mediator of RNA polymerase II transcription subunit 19 n=1 Tax=Ascobolus immersus RN42 TaxID=1160509 RepID=A0A3N4HMG8_ASCIM|nr:mediator complex, subunit MED19 [Ascobolus immersus RN42]